MLRVTTLDLETGDTETKEVAPGDYCIVTAWPLVLAHVQEYPGTGTVQLTLKLATEEED